MKLTLTALTVAASLMASGASAFDPAHLQKLKDTNECYGCDLFVANLRGADLEEAFLSKANLSRADLTEAELSGAVLMEVDLSKANLSDANLTGANLTGANLSYATMQGVILCNTTMPDQSIIYSGC